MINLLYIIYIKRMKSYRINDAPHCKKKSLKININLYEVLCIYKLWNLIYVCDQAYLKKSHIGNKENFCNIHLWMCKELKFLGWILKKDRLLEILKIIHTCRMMSMLQIFLGIMKITINIVNNIDLYEDCPFKIPMLWFPISIILTSICIYRI